MPISRAKAVAPTRALSIKCSVLTLDWRCSSDVSNLDCWMCRPRESTSKSEDGVFSIFIYVGAGAGGLRCSSKRWIGYHRRMKRDTVGRENKEKRNRPGFLARIKEQM